MFDNLLYQHSSKLIADDITSGTLPGAILLSGPAASGKLTCALEIARILSCTGSKEHPTPGHWLCNCPSCLKNKELIHQNVLLAGSRECSLEILAAKKALLTAVYDNASYLPAARFFFLRAVRKLTMRFSQTLWEDDDKASKISPVIQNIDECLESLEPKAVLPAPEKLEKLCDKICDYCDKLESTFLYKSLPINQIRNASSWAHLKSVAGKKVIIIENAEQMREAPRNALLKILEEPPEDTVFVLTTAHRGAIMQTILSRVRTYSFCERTPEQQAEVIDRVFHAAASFSGKTIEGYLQQFLPMPPDAVKQVAFEYYQSICTGKLMPPATVVKNCAGFSSKFLFKIFLIGIQESCKNFDSPVATELFRKNSRSLLECYNNVSVYNQNPTAALEKLTRDLALNRRMVQ